MLVSAQQRDRESYQSSEPVAGKDVPGLRVAVVQRASKNCWESMFSVTCPGKAASRPLCAMGQCVVFLPKLIKQAKAMSLIEVFIAK